MPMDPKLMIDFLERQAQAEEIIKEAIRAELKPLMDVASERLTDAQDNLEAARKAMESPQAAVKVVDGEILEAENEIAARATLAGSEATSVRVTAKALMQQWQVELEALQDKRAELITELAKFEAGYAVTVNALDKAEIDVAFMVLNLANPFKWYGQSTDAFKLWLEWGGGTLVLHYRNEDNDAYDAAKAHLETLCHKNEVYPVKRDVDKLYRDLWDKMRDEANPPTETTVHNAVAPGAGYEKWDDYSPIEDFRGAGPKDLFVNPPVREQSFRDIPMADRGSLRRP